MVNNDELNLLGWTFSFDHALQGVDLSKVANTSECQSLERLFDIKHLHALRIDVKTKALSLNKAKLEMVIALRADISQVCGVSLEVFRGNSEAELKIEIMRARDLTDEIQEIGAKELCLVDLNEPDIISGTDIVLDHYVIEALGMAYDPYARAPGVEFETKLDEQVPSPFAKLESLLIKPKS
jgi:hypothetical protein